ncbi:hypothetical protein HYU17_03765 [Candidatus Woesearchaeota archaeon]|nr:hypothetical protein [Candidatus Woesearchaeota archaeon]
MAAKPGAEYSINDVAKACSITPNGAYKILRKLEKEGVLKAKHVANIKAYKPDFDNEKTMRVYELAFMPDELIPSRIKLRADDFKQLKAVTKACILFGSYITTKQKPDDIDALFVVGKNSFEGYKKTLAKVQDITPVKIHDIVQTTEDLRQNLKKNDQIVTEALHRGIALWGFGTIIQVIKNATQQR